MDLAHSSSCLATPRARVWQNLSIWLERYALVIVAAMMIGYTIVLTTAAIAKYNAYAMGFDLALYEQQIWNTSQGRWFETSIFSFTNNALGVDLQLIEAPLALAYALVPSVFTLLFLQSAALALGALPLYLLARNRLGAAWAGLALAFAYLLYPIVVNTNLYELRLRSFAVAPLLFSLYFLETKRARWFYVSLFLALLCRTDIGLVVAMIGVYALWRRRPIQFWSVPIIVGVMWVALSVFVIVPRLSSGAPFLFTSIYSYLGDTPSAMMQTIVTRPLFVLENVITAGKLEYLNGLFAPVAYLALLNPAALLIAAPTFALNLLSPSRLHWDLTHGYSILIAPFVFAGTVQAIRWLRERAGKTFLAREIGLGVLIGLVVLATLLVNVLWGNGVARWIARKPSPRVALVREIAAQIPNDASLAASSLVAPILPPRRALYYFPGNQSYGVSNLDRAEFIFVDQDGANEQAQELLAKYRQDPRWQVLVEREGLVLLKRKD